MKVRTEKTVGMKEGMMNIGTRPTFGGEKTTLEVNIFDFTGDLYSQLLMVSFEYRIRGEQKFSSPEALAKQLAMDQEIIKRKFKEEL